MSDIVWIKEFARHSETVCFVISKCLSIQSMLVVRDLRSILSH